MALSPRYLSHVADQLEDLWGEFETDVLSELAIRVKANDFSVSATSKWKYAKLHELGYTNNYLNTKIAAYLKKTDKQVKEIFDNALGTALVSNQEIYQEAYEQGIIVSSGYDARKYAPVVSLGARQTYNEIKNWTKSYHADVNKNFQLALDLAHLNVTSGLMTSTQASKQAIEELAKNGILTSSTKGGRVEHADVIVKRAIRSGVNQTTSRVMDGVMDDLECDLVETSSHLGARPSHAMWQGKVFSRSGKHKKYPDFKKGTGYGTGDGLCGWNCRHMFFPYFEGLSSVSAKRYSMQENERVYNLEQKQRYNERMIRKYRREERVLKAGEQDYTFAQNKAIRWSKTNEALINSNSDVLKRNYANELLAKNYNQPVKQVPKAISIKSEFLKNSTPGIGNISFEDNLNRKTHAHEISIAEWLKNTFGGEIKINGEANPVKGVYTCDYLWNGFGWELKGASSLNSLDKGMRKALKQIENNPGGVILDILKADLDLDEKMKTIILERIKKTDFDLVVIIKKEGNIEDILKYIKR